MFPNFKLLALATVQDCELRDAVGDSARVLLTDAQCISNAVSESWDYTWQVILSGHLYHSLNNIGVFIAAGCLALWCLNFAKKWIEGDGTPWVLQELIWPMVAIILLANGGSNMTHLSRSMRDFFNAQNQKVLATVSAEKTLEETLAELGDFATVDAKISQLRDQCNGTTDNDKLVQCLKDNQAQLQKYIDEYKRVHPKSNPSLLQRLQGAIDAAKGLPTDFLIKASNVGLMVPMVFIMALMSSLQWCFQMLVECGMLLTALLAPLALGASLLPFGAKPIYAWFLSFWSLALCKLSYNIVSGITAIAIYKLADTNTMGTAIFFGLFAPILAIAMATGGGMAIFNGVLAASTALAGLGFAQVGRSRGHGSYNSDQDWYPD